MRAGATQRVQSSHFGRLSPQKSHEPHLSWLQMNCGGARYKKERERKREREREKERERERERETGAQSHKLKSVLWRS